MTTEPEIRPYWSTVWNTLRTPELEQRVSQLAAFADQFLGSHKGIELHSITIRPNAAIEIFIVRDDVDGADDEQLSARQLKNALKRRAPELAANVTVVGDYCK